ncbi:Hypothetical predicted protein [Paramuricea clavata]|uniref:Uncharacterized protein n=1 Tax=Paramuricea clavata TaxID=317549 RepID=A0A6S7K6D4_PARCT|nr:Hypothetical predicted protein [Paramuricea clavata]
MSPCTRRECDFGPFGRMSKEGIATDPEKIRVIRQWPVPTNLTDLRSFLGLTGYYRQFIDKNAEICRAITPAIQASAQYHLSDKDTKKKVISYAAKALSKAEENYNTTRKDLLALIWGLENFAPYLVGKQFIARTDHSALRWIKNFKQPKGQVVLWIKRLSIFDFVVEHRPGRNHGNADGMSLIPLKDTGVVDYNVCKTETAQVFNIPTENRSTTWCQPGNWSSNKMGPGRQQAT